MSHAWKTTLVTAVETLARQRIGNPLQPVADGGATLLDEAAMIQSLAASSREYLRFLEVAGDPDAYAEAAAGLADGLSLASNWAIALQTAIAICPADSPLRAKLEPLRVTDRATAELSSQLLQRTTPLAARLHLQSLGLLAAPAPPPAARESGVGSRQSEGNAPAAPGESGVDGGESEEQAEQDSPSEPVATEASSLQPEA
jgi:hypothetical protein